MPSGRGGQVSRVAARFGLVAAGGEMARRAGVLPWPSGEAMRGVKRCFRDWLVGRGGIEPAEDTDAVAAVRRFIELHGTSRFEAMGDLAPRNGLGELIEQRVPNRVGFRRHAEGGGIEYLVLPEAWKAEVCAGLDAGAVAKTLARRGILIGKDGKLQHQARLPGFDRPVRHYRLLPNIMSDEDGNGDDATAG